MPIFNKLTTPIYDANIIPNTFWYKVNKLEWMDISEASMDPLEIKLKIMSVFGKNLSKFNGELDFYVNKLKDIFIKRKHKYVRYTDDEKDNYKIYGFLAHIVLKGEDFYNAVCIDIGFAEYLLINSEYHNILDSIY